VQAADQLQDGRRGGQVGRPGHAPGQDDPFGLAGKLLQGGVGLQADAVAAFDLAAPDPDQAQVDAGATQEVRRGDRFHLLEARG